MGQSSESQSQSMEYKWLLKWSMRPRRKGSLILNAVKMKEDV